MAERPPPSPSEDAFWCACRLAITVEGPRGSVAQVVPRPFARIGGHADADVRMAAGGMALRSFYLHATEQGVYCVPLFDSRQGAGAPRGWLQPGQVLCVEPYRIAVRLLDGAADARVRGVPPPNLDAARSVTRPYPLLRITLDDKPQS